MKLKLGKMTSKEMAEWFGISYQTYKRNISERIEKIQNEYGIFELCYGGVVVKKIYVDEYIRENNSTYKKVKSKINENWNENGLDTKKNVANKIYDKEGERLGITRSTTYNYTCKGTNELFGRANDPNSRGEIGTCRYALCVLDTQTNEPRWFTETEFQKKKELQKKYFGSNCEKNKEIQDLKEAIFLQEKNGEITEQECAKMIHGIEKDHYFNYLNELQNILGDNVLVYRTYIQRYYDWGEKVEESV